MHRPATRFKRGLVAGLIGAGAVAAWFFILDVIAGLVVGGIAVTVMDALRSVVAFSARLTPSSLHTAESERAE